MMKLGRRNATILLSMVAIAALLGGWYVTTYAASNSVNSMMPGSMGPGMGQTQWQRGSGFAGNGGNMPNGVGRNEFVVSAEYNQTVVNIAKSDVDVQKLLAEGYSVSNVRPIIKSVVQGDGTVVKKATSAVVMLKKDTTGRASIWVDVTAAKVTRIVTMINKS